MEDARFVLAAKLKAPLDIIVSQPSHSWLAGAANLFTKEFFEIVKGNLTEQGVFSQWLNLYNMDVDTLQSILYTFYEVFPHGAVFSAQGDQEMILLGSKSPLKFNGTEAERLSNSTSFRRRLAQVPLNTPSDVLAHFALDRDRIRSIASKAVINTDVNAYAESRQSRTFYAGIRDDERPQAFLLANYRSGFAKLLDGTRDWDYGVLLSLLTTGQHEKFYAYLKAFEDVHKNDPARAGELGWLCLKAQRYESARTYLEKAFAYRRTTSNLNMLMSTFSELNEHEKALTLVAKNPKLQDQITQCYRANAEMSLGRNAEPTMQKIIADIPGYTFACGDFLNRIVGDYFFRKNQYQVAIPFYDAYYKAYDHDVQALRRLSEAYLQLGEWRRSAEIANRLGTVVENERTQLKALGAYYAGQSLQEDSAALQKRAERPVVN